MRLGICVIEWKQNKSAYSSTHEWQVQVQVWIRMFDMKPLEAQIYKHIYT